MNTERPPDTVLELLRKVKALADTGAPGEREAARTRLDALLSKHGITEAQLCDEQTTEHAFTAKGLEEELLLYTVVARLANGRKMPKAYVNGKKNVLLFKLTPAQIVDAETQYDFYREQWKKERGLFFRAFIFAQNLHMEGDGKREPETEEQMRDRKRVAGMQMFVDNRTPHRQLEGARR